MTALIRAIKESRPLEEIRRILSEDEKQVDVPGPNGQTPLEVAILSHDFMISTFSIMPLTARRRAQEQYIQNYRNPLILLLLDHGASAAHFEQITSIELSAIQDPPLLEKLLQKGLPVDLTDADQQTLLIHYLNAYREAKAKPPAQRQSLAQLIDLLLQHGASTTLPVQAPLQEGETAIHFIARGPMDPYMFGLLERLLTPETVQSKGLSGATPLITYAKRAPTIYKQDRISAERVVRLMLSKGANLADVDKQGLSPMDWANRFHNDDLEEALEMMEEEHGKFIENTQQSLVESTGNASTHGITPNIAKRITNFLGGKRYMRNKSRKGRKGRKTRKAKKARQVRKAHTRRRA